MSYDFMMGVPGMLKKVWEKVQLLSLASTAMDKTTWTDAKAAFLDSSVSDAGTTFKHETFTGSGTWTRPAGVDAIHVLMVAAGGGGAGATTTSGSYYSAGGGGGGGQVIDQSITVIGNVTVTIPGVASGGVGDANGSDGGSAILSGGCSLTALGGEGGAYNNNQLLGGSFGSGGGVGISDRTAYAAGGGGGGASSKGVDALDVTYYYMAQKIDATYCGNNGGAAGQGTGALITAAGDGGAGFKGLGGGGGGGGRAYAGCGNAGGGSGGTFDGNGYAANSNSGSGGGGGSRQNTVGSNNGGNGGSGFCIISWWE